jgi:hypothetical protein
LRTTLVSPLMPTRMSPATVTRCSSATSAAEVAEQQGGLAGLWMNPDHRVLGLELQVPELGPAVLLLHVHPAELRPVRRVVVQVGVHRAQPAGQRLQRRVQPPEGRDGQSWPAGSSTNTGIWRLVRCWYSA